MPDNEPFVIVTYGKCQYCDKAKSLLTERGFAYTEKEILTESDKRIFVDAGYKTVPQISRGEKHIGGYDDLREYLG